MKGLRAIYRFAALLLLWCSFALAAHAQVATQAVTVTVDTIHAVSVSSGAVSLTIDTATPGSDPDDAVDNTTHYNITTNGTGMKLTGVLDAAYASGLLLAVTLDGPGGSSSAGQVTLSHSTSKTLVSGIANVAETSLTITYRASATAAAVPNDGAGGETNTVTITLTDL